MAKKENLDRYRHKWEIRMVNVAIAMPIIAVALVASILMLKLDVPQWLAAILLPLIASPIIVPFVFHYNFWKEVVDAVEVTEKQYPDLYKIFKEQVERGGFTYTPRLFIKNGNGLINAFATKSGIDGEGGYVVIYSDIVDTFYDMGNKNTIRFVISHELGHLKLGHITVKRNILKGILQPVFLTNTLVRAQEYSADRFGASITDKIAMSSLAIVVVGKRNYEKINTNHYIENDSKEINRFWVAIVSFMKNHPVGRRRLAAARKMDKDGWENVHGNML